MSIKDVPHNLPLALRDFLTQMRNAVVELQEINQPPRPVINLVATAKAGGVIIQFTRTDGDHYIVYANTTPTLKEARVVDIGNKGEYVDDIGKSAELRYYWVRAKKGNLASTITGPVFATTLGLAVEITPPIAPPTTDEQVYSDELGYPVEK